MNSSYEDPELVAKYKRPKQIDDHSSEWLHEGVIYRLPLAKLIIIDPIKKSNGTMWREMIGGRPVFIPNKPKSFSPKKRVPKVEYITKPVLSNSLRAQLFAISKQNSNLGILAKGIIEMSGAKPW